MTSAALLAVASLVSTCDAEFILSKTNDGLVTAAQPEKTVEAVADFESALREVPIPWRSLELAVAPNGRSVLALDRLRPRTPHDPTGVWIWADWQSPSDHIFIDDRSDARFVGSGKVMIGRGLERQVIDFERAEGRRYAVARSITTPSLQVNEHGQWSGTTHDKQFFVGELDSGSVTTGGPIAHGVVDSVLLQNSAIVLTEDDVILAIDFESGEQQELLRGQSADYLSPVGTTACSVTLTSDAIPFFISRRGEDFVVIDVPEAQGVGVSRPSPSGRFAIVYRRTGAIVRTDVVRLPITEESGDDPLPKVPRSAGIVGWLTTPSRHDSM